MWENRLMGFFGKKKEKCDACNKPFEELDECREHMKIIHPATKPCTKCFGLDAMGTTAYWTTFDESNLCVSRMRFYWRNVEISFKLGSIPHIFSIFL